MFDETAMQNLIHVMDYKLCKVGFLGHPVDPCCVIAHGC